MSRTIPVCESEIVSGTEDSDTWTKALFVTNLEQSKTTARKRAYFSRTVFEEAFLLTADLLNHAGRSRPPTHHAIQNRMIV